MRLRLAPGQPIVGLGPAPGASTGRESRGCQVGPTAESAFPVAFHPLSQSVAARDQRRALSCVEAPASDPVQGLGSSGNTAPIALTCAGPRGGPAGESS
jgi:hypothetical protein